MAVPARKELPSLAVMVGVGKPKPASKSSQLLEEDEGMGSEVDPDFEEQAVKVWPELEGDTARLSSLQAAIRAAAR